MFSAWGVRCVEGGCNLIITEHGRYSISCMQKLWSACAVLSLYGMLDCELRCELLLLLQIWIVLHMEGCGVSSAECLVQELSSYALIF